MRFTVCRRKNLKGRASESGSALVYILIAIALLAALTFSFMGSSSQQTSSQGTFKAASTLQGQVDTIRSALQECVLLYPNGDGTIVEAGYNRPYPLNPDSTHLPVAGGYRAADKKVSNIRCPGANDGVANQHKKIFSGASGKFVPPPPDLFIDWQYYNSVDGVFFWIETNKSDAYIKAALEKMDERYGECEADLIDASGGAVDLDSGTTISCPSGSLCFRVWMFANASASAVHQDAASGCP